MPTADPHLLPTLQTQRGCLWNTSATTQFIDEFPDWLGPLIIIMLITFWAFRQMQGGMSGKGGPLSFGRSRAR